MIRRYRHLLSISSRVLCCYILCRQLTPQTCGYVTLFVVINITENGGMTIWQHGSICIEKINTLEIEEKWFMCPGENISEHLKELTNKVIAGSHVQWGTETVLGIAFIAGKVMYEWRNILAHFFNHCCSG